MCKTVSARFFLFVYVQTRQNCFTSELSRTELLQTKPSCLCINRLRDSYKCNYTLFINEITANKCCQMVLNVFLIIINKSRNMADCNESKVKTLSVVILSVSKRNILRISRNIRESRGASWQKRHVRKMNESRSFIEKF